MDKKMRGQATIWVILSIVLVGSIILFVYIQNRVNEPTSIIVDEVDPHGFIDDCTRQNVNDVVDIMLPRGGFVNPGHSRLYNDVNVSYLCFNRGNYLPCVNQHPLFLNEMTAEIKEYITPKIDRCFQELKGELEKRRSSVSLSAMEVNVALAPNRVYVDIDREMTISKNDVSSNFNNFDSEILNPIYDLGRIAMEIASQEAQYCYFEYVGYMILYPDFKITRTPGSDSTIIYSITDNKSGKKMNIAIRGCAIPPGL